MTSLSIRFLNNRIVRKLVGGAVASCLTTLLGGGGGCKLCDHTSQKPENMHLVKSLFLNSTIMLWCFKIHVYIVFSFHFFIRFFCFVLDRNSNNTGGGQAATSGPANAK